MQKAMLKYSAGASCAYDVGAQVGFFTLFLSATLRDDARVFAFEPTDSQAQQIEAVARCNQLENRLSVFRLAVADTVGTAKFFANDSVGVLQRAIEGGKKRDIAGWSDVPTVSLDAFVYEMGNQAPDFIKLDVESAEPLVLAGAQRLLADRRPTWLIEVHGAVACHDTIALLLGHGYRVLHVSQNGESPIIKADQLNSWFGRGRWTTHIVGLADGPTRSQPADSRQ